MESLYFDYNATRSLRDCARQKILNCIDVFGNPSSIHKNGRAARAIIEEAREKIAAALNLSIKRIVFTSGATEANNTILHQFKPEDVYISSQEHDSIHFAGDNFSQYRSHKNGLCDLNHLEDLLKKKSPSSKPFISMVAVNSETGIVQPLDEAWGLANKYGAYIHTDAVQAIGRSFFKWSSYDFISFSGHKLGALQGVGVLVIPEKYAFNAFMRGGGQEQYRRSGTENMMGIASLGAVMEDALSECWENAKTCRNFLEKELIQKYPEITIIGKGEERVANTTLFTMPGVKSELQVMSFDLAGIRVSAGSACSSGKVKPSRILKALGFADDIAATTLRVSLPPNVMVHNIEKFIETWERIYAQCKN